nr:conserved putative Flap endonuclease [Marseillevirus cajuinensis]
MGIQDLNKLLKEESPLSFSKHPMSTFSGKKVGIDAFGWLFRFLRASGDEGVLPSFLSHICALRKNGVLVFCVFDGPECPEEKRKERENRKKDRDELIEKKKNLERILEEFDEDCEVVSEEMQQDARKWIQKKKYASVDLSDPSNFSRTVLESLGSYTKQSEPLTNKRVESVKTLLDILGVRYVCAKGEADGILSAYVVKEKLFAACSADTDVHAYGVPFAIPEVDTSSETVTLVHREQYLEDLGLTEKQFLDLCIMCGCDYNDRATQEAKTAGKRPRGIGWKTALSLIRKHGSLEEIEKVPGIDMGALNYKRCRELFQLPEQIEEIPPGGKPEKQELASFFEENDVHFDVDYVIDCWCPIDI